MVLHRIHVDEMLLTLLRCFDLADLGLRTLTLAFPVKVQFRTAEGMWLILVNVRYLGG